MPGPDEPLNYATPRPASGRPRVRYVSVAVCSHILASYAVAVGWLTAFFLSGRPGPDPLAVPLAVLAPIMMPLLGIHVAVGLFEGDRHVRESAAIIGLPYAAAFATLFWWLARRERRRRQVTDS